MYQYEAVIKVMEDNGGFATLGHLYRHALKVPGSKWGTKTPFASIRRIVQDDRFFFRIRPGLWALKSHRDAVLTEFAIAEDSPPARKEEFDHSYYQGLLLEIGNLKGLQTFVPNQDKNKLYLSKPLGDHTTLQQFYDFTYKRVLQRARTIDVTWFNKRRFPDSFFEVEHTTDMHNSLLKFVELQDFGAKFNIVAPQVRSKEFERKISFAAFESISQRVQFISYKRLSGLHSKMYELREAQEGFEI